MSTIEETYILSNEVVIPKLALGTWFISDADAGQAYDNEKGLGEGIRSCSVAREEMFVTTKLAAEEKSYHEAVQSIDKSLQTLGPDYIDMMIIHSPQPPSTVQRREFCQR